jgi:protein-S-isoprenylcysteine O-methyltransferase Ste14
VALRAVLWSTIFVGTVAGYIPWRFFGFDPERIRLDAPATLLGLGVGVAGAALALACILEFVRTGLGTPAPMDPPRELVARGPYRLVRNPMYVGMFILLCGEALLVRSLPLLGYAIGWLVFIHLVVVGYEEPTLRAKFGDSYERYTARVRRWWPSLRRSDERS